MENSSLSKHPNYEAVLELFRKNQSLFANVFRHGVRMEDHGAMLEGLHEKMRDYEMRCGNTMKQEWVDMIQSRRSSRRLPGS